MNTKKGMLCMPFFVLMNCAFRGPRRIELDSVRGERHACELPVGHELFLRNMNCPAGHWSAIQFMERGRGPRKIARFFGVLARIHAPMAQFMTAPPSIHLLFILAASSRKPLKSPSGSMTIPIFSAPSCSKTRRVDSLGLNVTV